LADRAGLTEDLDEADDYDVLLTELKAAAVDLACGRALERGAEVVFVDNRATAIEGDDLEAVLADVVALAVQRGRDRE
jgi:cyclic 2,3-diphosphoglycerate synthetase